MQNGFVKVSGIRSAPHTTENAMYPDVDNSYTEREYEGERLILRYKQKYGIRQFGTIANGMQGFAVFGNLCVRMGAGSTHYIYSISENGLSQLATFSANADHSNSLQFAPAIENGQTYPYLYVANLPDKCSVFSISANYAVAKIQTITIGSGIVEGGNLQIGEDGYIWYCGCAPDNSWRVVKFRRVLVSEGDVTLTSNDILDDWTTAEKWPYSTYLFQGSLFKRGQYWQVYGQTGANAKRGFVIYDTATHCIVASVDISSFANFEPEDFDFWNGSLILCGNSTPVYQLQF